MAAHYLSAHYLQVYLLPFIYIYTAGYVVVSLCMHIYCQLLTGYLGIYSAHISIYTEHCFSFLPYYLSVFLSFSIVLNNYVANFYFYLFVFIFYGKYVLFVKKAFTIQK